MVLRFRESRRYVRVRGRRGNHAFLRSVWCALLQPWARGWPGSGRGWKGGLTCCVCGRSTRLSGIQGRFDGTHGPWPVGVEEISTHGENASRGSLLSRRRLTHRRSGIRRLRSDAPYRFPYCGCLCLHKRQSIRLNRYDRRVDVSLVLAEVGFKVRLINKCGALRGKGYLRAPQVRKKVRTWVWGSDMKRRTRVRSSQ